jgi:hypothetical protein
MSPVRYAIDVHKRDIVANDCVAGITLSTFAQSTRSVHATLNG